MPEEENSKGFEKLVFMDEQGEVFLGARMEQPGAENLMGFYTALKRYLGEDITGDFYQTMAMTRAFDGGKHGRVAYYLFDSCSKLNGTPKVMRW